MDDATTRVTCLACDTQQEGYFSGLTFLPKPHSAPCGRVCAGGERVEQRVDTMHGFRACLAGCYGSMGSAPADGGA